MEITQAEAARILGVSGAAIAYALKSGRIKCEIRHGKKWIERNGLEEKWGNGARRMPPDPRYRGEKKPLRSLEERLRPRPEQQPEAEQIATVPAETVTQKQSEVPDYNESRARTEYLKAELMEFDRAEKEGELIRADAQRPRRNESLFTDIVCAFAHSVQLSALQQVGNRVIRHVNRGIGQRFDDLETRTT